MIRVRRPVVHAALVVLAIGAPAAAQGNSQSHRNGKGPASPSHNGLAAPPAAVGGIGTSTSAPFAWIDDATLLPESSVAVSFSAMRWSNADASEVDIPVVGAALGVTPRVQLSASVPRVAGADGSPGALGTSFFSAKVAVYEDRARQLKFSAAPTIQVLAPGVAEALGNTSRVQFGLPVSGELDRGPLRLYASTGYFSSGTWFFGTGATMTMSPKVAVSAGLSRAWRGSEIPNVPIGDRDRKELSGAASYAVTPRIAAFASIGRTIATLDENGAGTTIGGGLSFFLPAAAR